MRDNQKIIVIVLAVILILGISAVIALGGKKGSETVNLVTEVIEEIPSDTLVPENTIVAESVDSDDTPGVGDKVVDEVTMPTARVGLESTDPSTVNIASGDIQLIEFFAFW